jgi:hypothetical protein
LPADDRCGSKGDLTALKFDFRFTPESGLKSAIAACQFRANKRNEQVGIRATLLFALGPSTEASRGGASHLLHFTITRRCRPLLVCRRSASTSAKTAGDAGRGLPEIVNLSATVLSKIFPRVSKAI